MEQTKLLEQKVTQEDSNLRNMEYYCAFQILILK